MTAPCTVSGVLRDASGALMTSTKMTFQRIAKLEAVEGETVVVPVFGTASAAVASITTDVTTAAFSVDLMPGIARAFYQGPNGQESIDFPVPVEPTADFAAQIGQATTIIESTLVQQVFAARDLSQAYAQTAEDTTVPGGSGYSALHYATKAAASADLADSEGKATIAQNAAAAALVSETNAAGHEAGAEAARDATLLAASNAQASALTLATWAALSAITGSTPGEGAEVLDSDAVTHTDPVVGGTVNNAGRYSWSASPAGWERIGATGLSGTVKTTGAQTVAGVKTFSSAPVVPDAAFPIAKVSGLAERQTQDAITRVLQYDSVLTFKKFVDTTTVTPTNVKHECYISTAAGTVLGITAAVGDLIVADGTGFAVVRDRARVVYPLSDPSYNKFDPNSVVPDHYLNTSTGNPVQSILSTRWMTDFMFVEGVTFIASNTYASGPMLAYDENKDFISVVPNTDSGTIGKYVLPAGTVFIRASGMNPDNVFMYLDDFSRFGTLHAYGVTEDSISIADTNAEVATKARIDYVDTLNIIDGVNVINPDHFIPGFSLNVLGQPVASGTTSITRFIYCRGRSFASTNLALYGGICAYDEDYNFIARVPTTAIGPNSLITDAIPATAYYIRGVFNTAQIGNEYLYWDTTLAQRYPFLQDRYAYKYKGKKLVTLGDSITYQKSWQPRLVELTGMVWSEDETRGGVGYVEVDASTFADIDNYVAEDAAIIDSGGTFVNAYGETLTLYEKGAERYRAAYSAAEGGDTVMPRAGVGRSLYSRCGDIKYYEPDVIIIHGGANDRGYITWLPTSLPNGRLSDITGLTNLESDDPDLISDYEIHTTDANFTDVGDYVAEGDTTSRVKYSGTFRAAYRGMLKKVIDGNPAAIIFLIQPPRTFLYSDTYQNKVAQYVADEVNRVIADVGKEFGCQVIDTSLIFGAYNAAQWFTSDGVWIHPNSGFGGPKIADYIASQIE